METLWISVLMVALAGAALHQRRERTRWPASHPRHQRAHMLTLASGSFWLLALASFLLGKEDTGAWVFGLGFIAWFAVLWCYRKRIPTEADIAAYEGTDGRAASPHQVKPPGGFWRATGKAIGRREQPELAELGRHPQRPSQRPAEPLPPPVAVHPRGSLAWALQEFGIAKGARAEDINAAYRRLIRMAHPDRGGDTAFAADLNLARQVLLEEETRPS